MSEQYEEDLTPVDDVRRVREEIDERFGGDIRKIAAYANAIGEQYREALGLKLVKPPTRSVSDGKAG